MGSFSDDISNRFMVFVVKGTSINSFASRFSEFFIDNEKF